MFKLCQATLWAAATVLSLAPHVSHAQAAAATNVASTAAVQYRSVKVDGLNIFYREAGPKNAPTALLLHGFPTSSQMFRNLIPRLADRYRVIAPDYPGYGQSDMPPMDQFKYSFDNLANVIDKFTVAVGATRFALYVQDYGAPIGYRIAAAHPERISAIVVQNGNAYDEGLATRSGCRPRRTGRTSRRPTATSSGRCSNSPRRSGSTAKAIATCSTSVPMHRSSTRPTWTGRATRTSSSRCSTATARTRRCIRGGRRTSASTSRRC